jgi:hypothetical protein
MHLRHSTVICRSQLHILCIPHEFWFLQDGPSRYYAQEFYQYLNKIVKRRRIGRGSEAMPTALHWPLGSPDLLICYSLFWGIIKWDVSKQRYTTSEMKEATCTTFQNTLPSMLKYTDHCTLLHKILYAESKVFNTNYKLCS